MVKYALNAANRLFTKADATSASIVDGVSVVNQHKLCGGIYERQNANRRTNEM